MSTRASDDTFTSANQLLAEQLERAQNEHGDDFDVMPLALTLLMHRVSAMLARAVTIDLEPVGLSSSQFNVLAILHRAEEPMTMRRIADTLSVRPPNLTTVVDSLVARKLAAKQVSKNDRRSFLVTTTARGDSLMAMFLPSHWRLLGEFFVGLTAEERVELARLLDRLLATVQPDGDSGQGIAQRIVDAALEAR